MGHTMGEGETRVKFFFFMTCWNGSVCQYLMTLASDTKSDSQNLDPLGAQGAGAFGSHDAKNL